MMFREIVLDNFVIFQIYWRNREPWPSSSIFYNSIPLHNIIILTTTHKSTDVGTRSSAPFR